MSLSSHSSHSTERQKITQRVIAKLRTRFFKVENPVLLQLIGDEEYTVESFCIKFLTPLIDRLESFIPFEEESLFNFLQSSLQHLQDLRTEKLSALNETLDRIEKLVSLEIFSTRQEAFAILTRVPAHFIQLTEAISLLAIRHQVISNEMTLSLGKPQKDFENDKDFLLKHPSCALTLIHLMNWDIVSGTHIIKTPLKNVLTMAGKDNAEFVYSILDLIRFNIEIASRMTNIFTETEAKETGYDGTGKDLPYYLKKMSDLITSNTGQREKNYLTTCGKAARFIADHMLATSYWYQAWEFDNLFINPILFLSQFCRKTRVAFPYQEWLDTPSQFLYDSDDITRTRIALIQHNKLDVALIEGELLASLSIDERRKQLLKTNLSLPHTLKSIITDYLSSDKILPLRDDFKTFSLLDEKQFSRLPLEPEEDIERKLAKLPQKNVSDFFYDVVTATETKEASSKCVALTGTIGSGKSAALRHLMTRITVSRRNQDVGIYFHAYNLLNKSGSLNQLMKLTEQPSSPETKIAINHLLKTSVLTWENIFRTAAYEQPGMLALQKDLQIIATNDKTAFFLGVDAVDEIPAAIRSFFINALSNFISTSNIVRCLVATNDYSFLSNVPIYYLQPLSVKQQIDFLSAYSIELQRPVTEIREMFSDFKIRTTPLMLLSTLAAMNIDQSMSPTDFFNRFSNALLKQHAGAENTDDLRPLISIIAFLTLNNPGNVQPILQKLLNQSELNGIENLIKNVFNKKMDAGELLEKVSRLSKLFKVVAEKIEFISFQLKDLFVAEFLEWIPDEKKSPLFLAVSEQAEPKFSFKNQDLLAAPEWAGALRHLAGKQGWRYFLKHMFIDHAAGEFLDMLTAPKGTTHSLRTRRPLKIYTDQQKINLKNFLVTNNISSITSTTSSASTSSSILASSAWASNDPNVRDAFHAKAVRDREELTARMWMERVLKSLTRQGEQFTTVRIGRYFAYHQQNSDSKPMALFMPKKSISTIESESKNPKPALVDSTTIGNDLMDSAYLKVGMMEKKKNEALTKAKKITEKIPSNLGLIWKTEHTQADTYLLISEPISVPLPGADKEDKAAIELDILYRMNKMLQLFSYCSSACGWAPSSTSTPSIFRYRITIVIDDVVYPSSTCPPLGQYIKINRFRFHEWVSTFQNRKKVDDFLIHQILSCLALDTGFIKFAETCPIFYILNNLRDKNKEDIKNEEYLLRHSVLINIHNLFKALIKHNIPLIPIANYLFFSIHENEIPNFVRMLTHLINTQPDEISSFLQIPVKIILHEMEKAPATLNTQLTSFMESLLNKGKIIKTISNSLLISGLNTAPCQLILDYAFDSIKPITTSNQGFFASESVIERVKRTREITQVLEKEGFSNRQDVDPTSIIIAYDR